MPDDPAADWPQPYAPPLTPNLDDLGYYDPSWGQLYGYDPTDWYNYDLSGYNQYGFDFLGFDRWGYDRWGYDRWGYDRWGYNWAGCNWAGYDRNGWDRDGRNEWGQRRDHPGDPRNQDWYNHHHPYEQYYQWKFQNDDPVYHRTQWDHAHGFNPNLYQNWNMSRDWHDPRNRDWAPPATTKSVTGADIRASSPVVNLNASLTQFISTDRATNNSRSLMKDLADKSARDFTRELTPRTTISIGSPPAVDAWEAPRHARSKPPNIVCATGIDGARARPRRRRRCPPGLPHPSCHRCPPTHRRRSPNRRESQSPHRPTMRREGTPILPRGRWRSRRRATRRTPRWHRRPSRYPRAHPITR